MKFEGEHLFLGQLGHFFVLLTFVTALLATVAFFLGSSQKLDATQKQNWLKLARISFFIQFIGIISIFSIVFYICKNHYYEYMYVYKHASLELEAKYLLACIWEGQEGSFLLWSMWHGLLGCLIILKNKFRKADVFEAPVMTVISLAQFFLMMMILGIYIGDTRLGNSLFTLTRNEIVAPIFSQPNYLDFIKDGMGLNVLLRNYWMVIHPPVLFLGFASTLIPFGYAYAGLKLKRYGEWVKPAIPFTLLAACVLGVGIMMGGKWAYESLSFGGYWAWDPVENASLVPWLLLISGLHTLVIYKATGHSLRASYFFIFLSFIFVLYSTFLTRTGVLGDTSVHSFTEAGKAINVMIGLFVLSFTIPSLTLFAINYKKIPAIHKEEETSSREFWMFIGSLIIFLSAIFIISKTSVPVYNKVFGTSIAPAEDVEFSYNKVMVLIAVLLGFLTATVQFLKYKKTGTSYLLKKIALPFFLASIIMAGILIWYPFQYQKQGLGFLIAINLAAFASIYAVLANVFYIFTVLKSKVLNAGASIAHAGFGLMILGMLISSANKEVISNSRVNGITLPSSKDPSVKNPEDPRENLTLIRQVPTRMGSYEVTYQKDSAGHEKGRNFYELQFIKKDKDNNSIAESFVLNPDVYLMKDNNLSSNPDTRSYLTKDIFTYISYALNKDKNEDTAQFNVVEITEKDSSFYGNGYIILNRVVKNPNNARYQYKPTDVALMADLTVVSKDGNRYSAYPVIEVDSLGIKQIDDTLYAQNLYLRFAGITDDHKIKLGIKESGQIIDFVAVKAYVFPLINLVWLGLIILSLGLLISMVHRAKINATGTAVILILAAIGLFYMFLLANA